jgi:hypothetical protein
MSRSAERANEPGKRLREADYCLQAAFAYFPLNIAAAAGIATALVTSPEEPC